MRKKIEWQFELLHKRHEGNLQESASRAKVIGGWIVIHTWVIKGIPSESMVFIPDRDHEWTILQPIKAEVAHEFPE